MRVAVALMLALAPAAGLAQIAPVAPVAPTAVAPALPADWGTLPQLRYLRPLPPLTPLSAFVRGEVDAGRCASVTRSAHTATVRVELAVLVSPDLRIRRIVPRAIGCMAVEQYATGLVSKLARDNLVGDGATREAWMRTDLYFAWPI